MQYIYVVLPIFIITVSILIVKIAAVMLNLTGLDQRTAFFQSLSAFTGTGFTTKDSELVLENVLRRKIIMTLMILGNAGLISIITTLVISLKAEGITPTVINIMIILIAVLVIITISAHKGIRRVFTKKVQENLAKTQTFTKRPVTEILRLAAGYGIAEVVLNENCIDLGKTLSHSSFRQQDILILAVERGKKVIPTPHAFEELHLNDTLICYGKLDNISKIGKKAMKAPPKTG